MLHIKPSWKLFTLTFVRSEGTLDVKGVWQQLPQIFTKSAGSEDFKTDLTFDIWPSKS